MYLCVARRYISAASLCITQQADLADWNALRRRTSASEGRRLRTMGWLREAGVAMILRGYECLLSSLEPISACLLLPSERAPPRPPSCLMRIRDAFPPLHPAGCPSQPAQSFEPSRRAHSQVKRALSSALASSCWIEDGRSGARGVSAARVPVAPSSRSSRSNASADTSSTRWIGQGRGRSDGSREERERVESDPPSAQEKRQRQAAGHYKSVVYKYNTRTADLRRVAASSPSSF